MRYMLDTNICILAIKKKSASVLQRLKKLEPTDVCISTVTYAELVHGVEKSAFPDRNRAALLLLLANIEIMDFNMQAADEYGRVRACLEKRGVPIGPLDTMIAGHAKSLGYTVVTNNIREFSRVEGLKVIDWTE